MRHRVVGHSEVGVVFLQGPEGLTEDLLGVYVGNVWKGVNIFNIFDIFCLGEKVEHIWMFEKAQENELMCLT